MLETGLYLWGFPGAALGAALITSLVSGGTQPQLSRAHNFKRLPYQPTKISQLKVFGFLAFLFQAPNLTVCDSYISKLLKVFLASRDAIEPDWVTDWHCWTNLTDVTLVSEDT